MKKGTSLSSEIDLDGLDKYTLEHVPGRDEYILFTNVSSRRIMGKIMDLPAHPEFLRKVASELVDMAQALEETAD